ncbi:DUF4133 domain-containing protein [Pontibacter sp. 172403-2]|uniref:DUF4133 domain-containing protein n=1 Tax=Pontibacter rufus TaxID=2791028 RepID=UPI0018B00DA6|nr:DUF4133 domain-containing protein [Pontibacter sp. 172403-2]MBF9252136.1 DUF4133 domain-containing protein [Pontibacter sp. 172403-2]
MSNSVYQINKGINKSIEFKGLKAQYIWYFGGGVIALLILFAIMYIIGINSFICIGIILIAGTVLTMKIYALSNTYGEYGMMKKLARQRVPKVIKSTSRLVFRLGNTTEVKVSDTWNK